MDRRAPHASAWGREEEIVVLGQLEVRPLQDAVVHGQPKKMGLRETIHTHARTHATGEGGWGEQEHLWLEVARKATPHLPRDLVQHGRPENGPPRPV